LLAALLDWSELLKYLKVMLLIGFPCTLQEPSQKVHQFALTTPLHNQGWQQSWQQDLLTL
jgi:hypothetical protein